MEVIEQLNIEFLSTAWFYIGIAVVAFGIMWIKDQDHNIHKRWYMPLALGLSFAIAVILVLLLPEYSWSTVFIHAPLIYVGQHFLGDQVIKRVEKKFKEFKV